MERGGVVSHHYWDWEKYIKYDIAVYTMYSSDYFSGPDGVKDGFIDTNHVV